MRTQILRTAAIAGLALGVAAASGTAAMGQSVTTDEPAGYLVFPRIVSDPNDIFSTGTQTNTVVQLTNTSSDPVTVHCFYINATGACTTQNTVGGSECRTSDDCVGELGTCEPQWTASDFTVTLSPQQPFGWLVDDSTEVTDPGAGTVPPVTTEFFVGELRCIQVNDAVDALPVNANDLQGVATIYAVTAGSVDVSKYNATGIPSVSENGDAQDNRIMCLGGDEVDGECAPADGDAREYAPCPAKLVVGHYFEGAIVDGANNTASTSLTLSPCSADVVNVVPTGLVAQILVFNEFEQRMSAATEVECVETFALADLGTIFNVNVQGTLTGQTHLRPVDSDGAGLGMIGLAEESITNVGSSAFHPNNIGEGGVDVVQYVFPAGP